MTFAALDTNESRRRHAGRLSFGRWLDADGRRVRQGYVYACPRCSFTSRAMRARSGAEALADQHALACPCDGSSSLASLRAREAEWE